MLSESRLAMNELQIWLPLDACEALVLRLCHSSGGITNSYNCFSLAL